MCASGHFGQVEVRPGRCDSLLWVNVTGFAEMGLWLCSCAGALRCWGQSLCSLVHRIPHEAIHLACTQVRVPQRSCI